jgi:hypothetical protein
MTEPQRRKIEFVAPGMWEALKRKLRDDCERMSNLTIRFLEDGNEFRVERVEGGFVPKRLRLEYDPRVPVIHFRCCDPTETRGVIEFRIVNEVPIYVVNSANMPLPDIVQVLASCMTGPV